MESEIIRMAISRYDGHMSEVARRLGIGRSTLYRKLKEFGLEPSDAAMQVDTAAELEEAIRKAAERRASFNTLSMGGLEPPIQFLDGRVAGDSVVRRPAMVKLTHIHGGQV